jgi:predicted lipoprotein with Yx(FWY)xxD motif
MKLTSSSLIAAVLLVALSACGGTAAVPAGSTVPVEPADHRIGVIMGMPSSRGDVLTDDYMMTLYRFDQDTAAPSKSTCIDACAVQWPPALVGKNLTFAGGDKALLGTVTRADGAKQLTLKGWPLYRFAGDRVEGDTKGHGAQGLWFAVDSNGDKVK